MLALVQVAEVGRGQGFLATGRIARPQRIALAEQQAAMARVETELAELAERIGELQRSQKRLEDEVATLSERLETRKVVDRAKGLLMTRQQMTEPEAFRWIQRTAMDRRTTMKAVAEAVVEGLATPRA